MQHFVSEVNLSNAWKAGPGGRGFVQTHPKRRVCGGLTKVLRQRIKGGKQRTVQTIANRQPGWRIMPSTRVRGATVHRMLMHKLMCLPLRRCTCGGGVPYQVTDRFSLACLEAARRFVVEYHLTPVAAEMVVLDKTLSLGTRLDALFRDTRNGCLVLVSWKTGVGATNECEWNRAQTQVAWEWMTMEKWRRPEDEHISSAFVVYLGAATIINTKQSIGFYAENRIARSRANDLYSSLMNKLATKH